MGINNTLDCLQQLPRNRQIALCTAALEEDHQAVQRAAMLALLDVRQLDRPGVVVDRFEELLAPVREEAAVHRETLVRAARQRMGSGTEQQRLSACRLLVELGDPSNASTFETALTDSVPEIRDIAAGALLELFREFAHALELSRAGKSHELCRDGWEPALWESYGSLLHALPQHGRSEFFALLPELGVAALPIVVDLLSAQHAAPLRHAIVEALETTPSQGTAQLTVALAAHTSRSVQDVGRQLMAQSEDAELAVTVARIIAERKRDREDPAISTPWPSLVLPVARELDPNTALALLAHLPRVDTEERNACIEAFLSHADRDVVLAAAKLAIVCEVPQRAMLLTPLIGSEHPELQQLAMREVSKVSFAAYLRRFDGMDPETRQIAARAVAKIDHTILDRLVEEISSLDPKTRFKALQIVGYLDAEEDLRAALMALLGDPDQHVRATVLRVVELTGSVPGMKALIDALSDPDRRVRANAIEAFEELEDDCYLEIFLPFLHDRDNRVRANAAKALWNVGHAPALDVLGTMLRDDDHSMRQSAVWALRELGCPEALELLTERQTTEPDADLRDKIQEALGAPSEEESTR